MTVEIRLSFLLFGCAGDCQHDETTPLSRLRKCFFHLFSPGAKRQNVENNPCARAGVWYVQPITETKPKMKTPTLRQAQIKNAALQLKAIAPNHPAIQGARSWWKTSCLYSHHDGDVLQRLISAITVEFKIKLNPGILWRPGMPLPQ